MKRINKTSEPKERKQFRETPGVTEYESIDPLRDSLLKEQGYICAYCMRRIPVKDKISAETSRIEHIKCRDLYPDLQFDYSNIVVCCPGCIDGNEHRDRSKRNNEITFSPFDIRVEQSISYTTKDGLIKSTNESWNKEINEELNLNNQRLKQIRKEVINGLRAILEKKKWTKKTIKQQLASWQSFDNKNRLKPYCGVIVWYLQKKLKNL
jgi:uncharacterized protein (TIGR02646 family)